MPKILDVVNYYTAQAPENLDIPDPGPIDSAAAGRFTVQEGPKRGHGVAPATSHVQYLAASLGRDAAIITCDMPFGGSLELLAATGWFARCGQLAGRSCSCDSPTQPMPKRATWMAMASAIW